MLGYCDNKECFDHLSYLPVTSGRFRQYEQLGLRVRSFVSLKIHDKLNPHLLAPVVGLRVLTLADLEDLSLETRQVLGNPSQQWSGGTTPELPDGSRIVILNPRQSQSRQSATLMEEICHVLLGHPHSRIATTQDAFALNENHREYNDSVEEEAYGVGAAALVPYRSLICNLSRGYSVRSIAWHFGVTESLIKYRIRVLKLVNHLI